MARTDYGAILSTVIKDTSDAIREVNDTSALIAPNAWGANIRTMHSDADYENALSYIPTKTVSGAIASFNDGAGGLDLKSLKVAITAKQSGSGTPAPDNIRPISGWSECNVVRCGKNIWSYGDVSGTRAAAVNDVFIPIGSYKISALVTSSDTDGTLSLILFACADGTNVSVRLTRDTRVSETVSLTSPATSITFYAGRTSGSSVGDTFSFIDIQLEVGSTATAYEAYNGNTYAIQLGDTYYGGSLNVTTGVLTITDARDKINPDNLRISSSIFTCVMSDMKSGNALAGMCDTFETVDSSNSYGARFGANNSTIYFYKLMDNISEITDLATAKQWFTDHDVYVVYPIATPITVQLTPTQIEQLLGTNNIWADTGDINECIYYSTASGVQSVEGTYQRADGTGVSTVPYLLYTYTATEDCTMCFCGTIATDTSQTQGYLKMVVNDDVEYRTAGLTPYNETPFSFDNISLHSGETVKFYGDWEGSHSSCFFHLRLSMVKAV